MKQFNYVITDEVGVHARPAGLLVKAAKEFESKITIEANGKSADLRKLMAIMAMGIRQGAEVTITCEGADEDKAAESLKEFFENNL